MNSLYSKGFEGVRQMRITLASLAAALFVPLVCPPELRRCCGTRSQFYRARYIIAQVSLLALRFIAKAPRFLSFLQNGLGVTKSPGIVASIAHSCFQLLQY